MQFSHKLCNTFQVEILDLQKDNEKFKTILIFKDILLVDFAFDV